MLFYWFYRFIIGCVGKLAFNPTQSTLFLFIGTFYLCGITVFTNAPQRPEPISISMSITRVITIPLQFNYNQHENYVSFYNSITIILQSACQSKLTSDCGFQRYGVVYLHNYVGCCIGFVCFYRLYGETAPYFHPTYTIM
jgi:hypothetical protein